MGISGTNKIFWKTIAISFDTAISTIEEMIIISNSENLEACSGGGRASVRNRRPHTVAIDANLIAYRYIGDVSSISPVGSVLKITRAFIEKGWSVIVVADHPTERHPSKRATCQRVGDKKKATIKAKIQRFELHSIQAMQEN